MPLFFDKRHNRKKLQNAEAAFFDMKAADAGRFVGETVACVACVLQELEVLTYSDAPGNDASGHARADYLMSLLKTLATKLKVAELTKVTENLASVMEQGTEKRLEAIRTFNEYLQSLNN